MRSSRRRRSLVRLADSDHCMCMFSRQVHELLLERAPAPSSAVMNIANLLISSPANCGANSLLVHARRFPACKHHSAARCLAASSLRCPSRQQHSSCPESKCPTDLHTDAGADERVNGIIEAPSESHSAHCTVRQLTSSHLQKLNLHRLNTLLPAPGADERFNGMIEAPGDGEQPGMSLHLVMHTFCTHRYTAACLRWHSLHSMAQPASASQPVLRCLGRHHGVHVHVHVAAGCKPLCYSKVVGRGAAVVKCGGDNLSFNSGGPARPAGHADVVPGGL